MVHCEKDFILVTHLGRVDFLAGALAVMLLCLLVRYLASRMQSLSSADALLLTSAKSGLSP